jgi:hypothetical protein
MVLLIICQIISIDYRVKSIVGLNLYYTRTNLITATRESTREYGCYEIKATKVILLCYVGRCYHSMERPQVVDGVA